MTSTSRPWTCPTDGHSAVRPSAFSTSGREPTTVLSDGTVACAHYQCCHTEAGRRAANTDHLLTLPWPEDCYVQGGSSGVMFTKERQPDGKHGYQTAFFEAFPRDPKTFLRGEGATVAEAETAAWAQWQKVQSCPAGTKHAFEPRSYTNGGGICGSCGMFSSDAFTGEELGQFCAICQTGTTYSSNKAEDGAVIWLCQTHHDELPKLAMLGGLLYMDLGPEELALVAAHVPGGILSSAEEFYELEYDVRRAALKAADAVALKALLARHAKDRA